MATIPRILHYCWFGRGEMPHLATHCIATWKKHLSDYTFTLWNEDNFDIAAFPYVREAYAAKKFAFVTDYVRLHVLYTVGGVYMDTDVELVKCLDRFLDHPVFSGFESARDVQTGLWASEPGHEIIKDLLDAYRERHFLLKNGSMDLTSNVVTTTTLLASRGLVRNNTYQSVCGFHIYPHEYFCAKCRLTGDITITENTHAIHHFAGSWWVPSLSGRLFKFVFAKPISTLLGKRAYVHAVEFAKDVRKVLSGRKP